MKTRSVVLLVFVALLVGAAVVYVFVREPERPSTPQPPKPWFDMPAPPTRTPNSAESYKRDPVQQGDPSETPQEERE